ncbi:molybdenum cofactor guanylyltransferase [Nocardioides scoriae]|uniref:molybdenum cofactor guanylyltransferase n=1 Tax=Nocardioides scoriae TaxID=642780 RepID=UPI001E406F28|nr:NTP transferase domain-containing protein [Nocardioides scoriae]
MSPAASPSRPPSSPDLVAVLLTGGTGRRLDGADKSALELGGATFLERALAALAAVPDVVVVGDEVATSRPVRFVREDPPGGGPAAALLAGLDAVVGDPPTVVVLAVDMPLVSAATVDRLLLSATGDGALLVDADGRRQLLCGVYSTLALRAAAGAVEGRDGLPVRRLLADLDLVEVPALAHEASDVDEWADLERLRAEVGEPPA